MTGSTAIDVVISLIFIFLLYSMLASIIQEIVTNILGLRSRILLKSIARMLDDGDRINGIRRWDLANFIIEFLKNAGNFFFPFAGRAITKEFYNHPSIKYLSESSWNDKPSYMRRSTFARTLIDMLKGTSITHTQDLAAVVRSALQARNSMPQETRQHLNVLFENAGGDIEKFTSSLEEWFDEVQERASGWFKRQTQLILFLIGFAIAWAFNVDSISIARLLAKNDKMREQFVAFSLAQYKEAYASGSLSTDSTTVQSNLDEARKELRAAIDETGVILGLGWETVVVNAEESIHKMTAILSDTVMAGDEKAKLLVSIAGDFKRRELSQYQESYWLAISGWILTALAISLGAPFWFDLLNKVAVVRSAVKPVQKARAI
jgi:hypothetical protein